MRLLLVGAPGAGKGTQGARLSGLLGVPHISSGAVLRRAVSAESPVGRRARRALERGELVPVATVMELLRERFRAADVAGHGYILDGFPRHVGQVRWLRELDPGGELDAVVHLVVPTDVVVDRLQRRDRSDDEPSVLRTRLAEYERLTAPMLTELARCAPLVVVDAARSIDEVTDHIVRGLEQVDRRSFRGVRSAQGASPFQSVSTG